MKHIASLLIFLATAVPAAASFDDAASIYNGKDYAAARQIAEPLAKRGDVRAMAMLGRSIKKAKAFP